MTDEVVQSAAPQAAPQAPSVAPEASVEIVAAPEVKQTSVSQEAEAAHSSISTVLGTENVEPAVEVPAEPAKVDVPAEVAPKEGVKPEIEAQPVDVEKKDINGADKQPEEKAKEEVSQSDEPAPLPSFEPWKLPDGIEADQTRVAEFNKELGEFARDTKVDAKLVQGLGQKLIDRHVSELQATAQKIAESYQKAWEDQSKSWYEQFVKDPEIGGNRQETTTAAAREFIRKHGGTSEQQTELRTVLEQTGLGNHPALIRVFAKANSDLSEGKLVPAGKPPAAPQSRKQRFYGSKG